MFFVSFLSKIDGCQALKLSACLQSKHSITNGSIVRSAATHHFKMLLY